MTRFLLRRLGGSVLVLLGLSVITFILARIVPGDPAAIFIGPKAHQADIDRVRIQLGLDQPLPVQYVHYLQDMLRGDWGTSIVTKRPVIEDIIGRLPATLELIIAAMVIAIPLGIILGVLSARWQGRLPDWVVRIVSIVGVSMPAFFLGLVLQVVFFSELGLFPLIGRIDPVLAKVTPITQVTGFLTIDSLLALNLHAFLDTLWHLALPALTLAAYPIAVIARMMRASMIETMGLDYVRTARAYGLRESVILRRSALRNAILPLLSVIGLVLAYSLTGTFFVEIVYSWPGLGQFAVKSILNIDFPAIMGITLFGALGYVLINLAVDIAQAWLDPRVRVT